jgi:hypothetical protein
MVCSSVIAIVLHSIFARNPGTMRITKSFQILLIASELISLQRISAFALRPWQHVVICSMERHRSLCKSSTRKVGRSLQITAASFWVIPEVSETSAPNQNSFHGITVIGNRQTRRRRASLTVQEQPFSNPLILSSLQKLRNVLYGLTEEHRQLDKETDRAQVYNFLAMIGVIADCYYSLSSSKL